MTTWKSTMRIRGILKDHLLYLRILTVCTVLSTASLILKTADNTSVENTSGKNESLELRWSVRDQGALQVKVTGKSTMEVVQSLKTMLRDSDVELLGEKSSHSIPPLVKPTMKRPDNSSFVTF